jgi:hypothetical protein
MCAFVVLNCGDSDILFCYNNETALPEEGKMVMSVITEIVRGLEL